MPALQAVTVWVAGEGRRGGGLGGGTQNTLWRVGEYVPPFSTYQLRTAPYEGQKLEVIQAPHALAACWLHPVCFLEFPHHLKVPAQEDGEGRGGSRSKKDSPSGSTRKPEIST